MNTTVLCIMDGVGIRKETFGNAFFQAKTPNLDFLFQNYPNTLLEASGTKVGLPEGQMGNSEVGHMNIGAGRVMYQPLMKITNAIEDGSFFENEELLKTIQYCKNNHSNLHIAGLLSDGGIHSHINHLFALIDLCKKQKVERVFYHLFLDGRDTLPHASLTFIEQLKQKIEKEKLGQIASVSGRYYAMDRDNNWDRVKLEYDVLVNGNNFITISLEDYIKENYEKDITDEFIPPACIIKDGKIKDYDSIIVYNFRPDRLRELFSSLTNSNFDSFLHQSFPHLKVVTMMPVSEEVVCTNAFQLETLTNTLGEYISKKGFTQLRIAETEKYAHVTYFFDGGIERKLDGCKRILVPSSKVATYDLKPEMSAYEITDQLLKELDKDYSLVVLNFANGDMVGHTGNFEATVRSIEAMDECIGKIYEKLQKKGGIFVVTADHGNSDNMIDENNNAVTSHSTSLVPLIITKKGIQLKQGKLADIAPTILTLMGLEIPFEMTGDCLIQK